MTIRNVPVSRAMGVYNDKCFDIWLYGTDKRCYCPDYPMTCCCGCTTYFSVSSLSTVVKINRVSGVVMATFKFHCINKYDSDHFNE